jgi:hypothetical protein
MSERIEFHGDISRPDAVPGVRYSRESRSEEAKKKFAQEFERKLSQEKDEDKPDEEKDEILVHHDGEDNNESDSNEKDNDKEKQSDGKLLPSDDLRGNRINLLA